jgi:phosphatidylserine/phosphatidylglycerophosphate/cardiolipin synthase-like enzyme
MQMYLLTDERAIEALAARAAAGCDVRVILERAPYLDERANEEAHARLVAAGARVRWATPRFTYTHAKAFTVDHGRLVVSTANLTRAGLHGNREYTVVDDDPGDVAAADRIFAGDEFGQAVTPTARIVASPETSRSGFLALVEGASRSVLVEVEQLSDRLVADALGRARARGVEVAVVLPESHGSNAAVRALLAAGVTVRAISAPGVHAKALAVDGTRVLVGSANLTPTSLDENRELGLLLEHPEIAARLAATIADDAARGAAPGVY